MDNVFNSYIDLEEIKNWYTILQREKPYKKNSKCNKNLNILETMLPPFPEKFWIGVKSIINTKNKKFSSKISKNKYKS